MQAEDFLLNYMRNTRLPELNDMSSKRLNSILTNMRQMPAD